MGIVDLKSICYAFALEKSESLVVSEWFSILSPLELTDILMR